MKTMFILASFLLSISTQAKSIEVMAYNVENLFDTKHDTGKNDWAYTPKGIKGKSKACKEIDRRRWREECMESNWSDAKLKMKLSQIKKVVTQGRELPDILALVEIENENVIAKLAQTLGYKSYVVSNSPDKRGVDLAVLYKNISDLKLVSKKEHIVKGDYFKKKPTRNILEVEFMIGKKLPFTLFVNHWPSLGNPNKARIAAASMLKNRIDSITKKNKNHSVLVVGDFNTLEKKPSKSSHPFYGYLLKDGSMKDLHVSYMADKKVKKALKDAQPLGSYFYGRHQKWNRLDRMFYNSALSDGKGLDIEMKSYKIYAPKFATRVWTDKYDKSKNYGGIPLRYSHKADKVSKAGFSDHFPLIVNLKF